VWATLAAGVMKPLRVTRTFPHSTESVPAARHLATATLRDAPEEVVFAVEPMVSELVTNCIRHTESGFQLTIEHTPQQIRVEVTDAGAGRPAVRSPGPTDAEGRGLRIVESLSDDWG
jgi:anti-sigma regulatory factor (Ser/Thr protein kinase)